MPQTVSFENFVKDARERKKNEALAQEFLGRGRKGNASGVSGAAKTGNGPEKPTLLSRINGGAGVQKRSTSAKPGGSIDGKWQHDLHRLNNPNGPAGRGRGIGRTVSTSQLGRNNRTYDKFASALDRNVASNARGDESAGFNIRGVANGGPYVVIASNFALGTTAADIEAVMAPHAGETLGCTLISAAPTVMVELLVATRQGAENVIATFNNQKADGRMLYVYLKEMPASSNAPVNARPPSSRVAQSSRDDFDLETSSGSRNGSFQDGRYGFSEGGRREPPRGPRRRY